MKRVILSTITAMSLASVAPYTAAMPVIDPAVFAQAVQQVHAGKTKREKMTNQLNPTEETKGALKGTRSNDWAGAAGTTCLISGLFRSAPSPRDPVTAALVSSSCLSWFVIC